MTANESVYLLLAVLNVSMALSLARYIPRFWRELPWLVPLVIYFSIRAMRKVIDFAQGHVKEDFLELGIDSLLAITLIALLVNANRMVRGFQILRDLAKYRASEYERAKFHYDQLIRHRIANPLTVILGSVETLRNTTLSPTVQEELLENISRAAREIEEVSFNPEPVSSEERNLNALPDVTK